MCACSARRALPYHPPSFPTSLPTGYHDTDSPKARTGVSVRAKPHAPSHAAGHVHEDPKTRSQRTDRTAPPRLAGSVTVPLFISLVIRDS